MTVVPLGDSAVVIVLGEAVDASVVVRARAIAREIEHHPPAGLVDVVPAFASVAVFFEPAHAPAFDALSAELTALVARAESTIVSVEPRTVEVPVVYGAEFGPDLPAVAANARLSADEATALHSGVDYLVHAVGFSPGFPYLGGLPARLATPRRATPRPEVPAGSVGIGGMQTGIYPSATPGGWNIIGQTHLKLFDPTRDTPALLRVGDHVRFQPISREELAQAAPVESPGDARVMGRDSTAGIEVLRAGMFTTVQDLGRTGHRASGVPLGGAADAFALRLVNALVGNPENAAGLEFTLVGPDLRFTHDTVVAIGGADFGGPPRWRPFHIRAGAFLKLGNARSGCRGYLAVAGGIDLAPVLGSRSTYVRARLGGFHGAALRDGDILPVPPVLRAVGDHWRIDERILPRYSSTPAVRVILGAQSDQFDEAWLSATYKVSSRSDRIGVRLTGPPVRRGIADDLLSSPVVPGTVQVPPDGQPIVLLADAQTIGGYPQIAHVISVDHPVMAQLRPGDAVRFTPVSLEAARELFIAQERAIALLREGLAQKLG